MHVLPQHLAFALFSILTLANAQFITLTTSTTSCTPTTLTTSTATIVGFSKPTHAPGGVGGVARIFPKEDFINNNVLTITSAESFWNKWLLPEQSAQKLTILENCSKDCASAPLCASVFIYLDTRNQATSYWTCMTFASAMDTADLEEAPTEAYKFGTSLNRQCFVQPPDVVVPTLPPSSSSEPTPTPSDPPASEPSSEPEPSSTTTTTSATGPTPTPSCFTRFIPPASLPKFWPNDNFFLRAYFGSVSDNTFLPESDPKTPTAEQMSEFCATACANHPPLVRSGGNPQLCKFALAFSENYGDVPNEDGTGGTYYRRCAFFTENLTEDDVEDAEALFAFGRVKDQIGLNSLCDALPPTSTSSTTSSTSTAPTARPTPSCFTRFTPPASLTNFWPSDEFFIRAYRVENAESSFFPESDFRSPTASEMADICANLCANLPPTGRNGNALPPCKCALAFSENYGGVPDENGVGGDYYRRCAFFTENITRGDLVDAEALFGFGRVKDQIGVNSLCDALPPTSSY